MSKKNVPLKFLMSYGEGSTMIGMKHLEATEYLLLKEFNDDILVRMKDVKMRNVGINITKLQFEIIQKEMHNKVAFPINNIKNFYLYTEGMLIAIFTWPVPERPSPTPTIPFHDIPNLTPNEVVEKIEETLDQIDKLADISKE